MKLTDLNPFSEIFETKKHPYARTLRNSFRAKMFDALFIIHGKSGKSLGLFDYATLGIFHVVICALELIAKKRNNSLLGKMTYFFSGFLIISITLLKFLLITPLLLLALPIAGIIHNISQKLAAQDHQAVLNLKLIQEDGATITLEELFKKKPKLKDAVLSNEEVDTTIKAKSTELVLCHQTNRQNPTLRNPDGTTHILNNPIVTYKIDTWRVSCAQKEALKGLFALNLFQCTKKVESFNDETPFKTML